MHSEHSAIIWKVPSSKIDSPAKTTSPPKIVPVTVPSKVPVGTKDKLIENGNVDKILANPLSKTWILTEKISSVLSGYINITTEIKVTFKQTLLIFIELKMASYIELAVALRAKIPELVKATFSNWETPFVAVWTWVLYNDPVGEVSKVIESVHVEHKTTWQSFIVTSTKNFSYTYVGYMKLTVPFGKVI